MRSPQLILAVISIGLATPAFAQQDTEQDRIRALNNSQTEAEQLTGQARQALTRHAALMYDLLDFVIKDPSKWLFRTGEEGAHTDVPMTRELAVTLKASYIGPASGFGGANGTNLGSSCRPTSSCLCWGSSAANEFRICYAQ
jgi:hypothetical protein